MRQKTAIILMLSTLLLTIVHEAVAAYPAINRPVNDYAGIISPVQEAHITRLIRDHHAKTGVQIAVLTVFSTGKMSIEDYSLGTAEKWGGGSKDRDDGLLFTVAIRDRRMRIETGYGLEGYIPDSTARSILDSIRGDFKKYQYGKGITSAVQQIIAKTDSLQPGQAVPATIKAKGLIFRITSYYTYYFFLGIIISIFFLFIKRKLKLKTLLFTLILIIIWIAIPAVIKFFFAGAWHWRTMLFVSGVLTGSTLITGFDFKSVKGKIIATVIAVIPAALFTAAAVKFLDIMKPAYHGETRHETYMLLSFLGYGFVQVMVWTGFFAAIDPSGVSGSGYSSTGRSYYSGSSSTSSNSSGSSSSSYSGSGGSFGGGGASSSW